MQSIQWTPDNSALAVGYAKRFFQVGGISDAFQGFVCMVYLWMQTYVHNSTNGRCKRAVKRWNFLFGLNKAFLQGWLIFSQCWGAEGYHLLVGSKSLTTDTSQSNNHNINSVSGKFFQFSFFKNCIVTNPNLVSVGKAGKVIVCVE